jgi:intracellular sulfur oxidation DsrE/DsrF family protein
VISATWCYRDVNVKGWIAPRGSHWQSLQCPVSLSVLVQEIALRRAFDVPVVKVGNPYAKLLDALMKQGVQIELCGATAAANHWTNKDLIPGVKVNTNAMVRVIELEQKGFTLIYE